jgi:hypothetical protein
LIHGAHGLDQQINLAEAQQRGDDVEWTRHAPRRSKGRAAAVPYNLFAVKTRENALPYA